MKNRKKRHAIGPFSRWWRLHFAKRIPGVCRVCGCTEDDPCYNPQYGYCWWSDDEMTLCSHCAEKDIALDPETVHCVNSEVLNQDKTAMETVNINTEKVREAIAPALAYQPKVEPKIISEENNPLVIIALPGIQALDLKALDSASTALCGFLGHRGQVGIVNGQLCLSFWKDDLQKEFHENA